MFDKQSNDMNNRNSIEHYRTLLACYGTGTANSSHGNCHLGTWLLARVVRPALLLHSIPFRSSFFLLSVTLLIHA